MITSTVLRPDDEDLNVVDILPVVNIFKLTLNNLVEVSALIGD